MKKETLLDKANSLPMKPGCYLMKNSRQEIIYVGKAKNLKSRVSSYFNQSAKNTKTIVLVGHICDFDFMIVNTEAEALVLENNLIKKYSPKYNIRLKDDKRYPYVVIDLDHPFPRLSYTRNWKRKKNQMVFGPYATGSNIREVTKIIRKNLYIRDCADTQFSRRKTPCLLFQLKQCQAPCVGYVTAKEYDQLLQLGISFFQGKTSPLIEWMTGQMLAAAENELFELAASFRDELALLNEFSSQSVQRHAEDLQGERNLDVFAYHRGEEELDLALFMVRNGILLGSKGFHFFVDDHSTSDEQVMTYLLQYYGQNGESLPDRVVVPFEREEREIFAQALNSLVSPSKIALSGFSGQFASLARLVANQAAENQRVRIENRRLESVGLRQLQTILELPHLPMLLECYDIAIWNGKSPTASQIVFQQGVPDKKHYRYYHLAEREEGNNDFAMLREVLERRLAHGNFPDVFIVDGGIGQVNVFVQVLKELDIAIPVVGIAKSRTESAKTKKEVNKSEERLIIPGQLNAIPLKKYRELMMILVQMRDEAHRFSRKLHHLAEKKRIIPE